MSFSRRKVRLQLHHIEMASPHRVVPIWASGFAAVSVVAVGAAGIAYALLAGLTHRRQITAVAERIDTLEDEVTTGLTLTQELKDIILRLPSSTVRGFPPHR